MIESLGEICTEIEPVALHVGAATQRLLDEKTKPRRSLGRLEEIACQVAAIRGVPKPPLPEKAIVVMGADHGVAAEGVSAYPQEVTAQMLLNFARGGAAINVLARHAGARVIVVDMGVKDPLPPSAPIRVERVGPGTKNFVHEPAMTQPEAVTALEAGIRVARQLAAEGISLLGIGEMGIGNTTSASALVAAFTGAAVEEVTGRGTGIDDATFRRKIRVIQDALELRAPDPTDAIDTLAKLGGFEIAGLAGVVLGAAASRIPVVIDGFIASTAALVATRIARAATPYLLASHRSVEAGHRLVLQTLDKKPLLDLDLRLGEGTGAALAMSLVDASLRVLHEMATFEAAQVSDSGA
jgi:nicotinate-nucleotide--dimethylbenzimidazole phosphoribosyltransferase